MLVARRTLTRRRLLHLDRVYGGTRSNILPVKAVIILHLLLVLLVGPTSHIHIVQADLTLMTFAANVVRLQVVVILLRA